MVKINYILFSFLLANIFNLSGATMVNAKAISNLYYDLTKPDQIDILPPILEEASGLTDFSESEVALVQDEKAIIFVYDFKNRKITKQIKFGIDGDYEGATRIGKAIYVLESNGNLYKVLNWEKKPVVEKISMDLPTKDNEGLGYDPVTSKLLIAPKSRWTKGKDRKNLRPIFGFDPKIGKVDLSPIFVLDSKKIGEFVQKNSKQMPVKVTKKGKKIEGIQFKPASIAIHPTTNEIFVISAVDKILVSFNRKGEVTQYWKLDEKKFPKPEGITFLSDSTLVISSEAGARKPTLMLFKQLSH